MKVSRFEYVKYDSVAGVTQKHGKKIVENLESFIESSISCPDAKAKALTKLEECYMWIGKGIRNDQITRGVVAEPEKDPESNKPYPYAYTHKITGKTSFLPHPHGGNAFIKRSPEKDRVLQ